MGKAALLLVVLSAGLLATRQFSDVGASVSSSEGRATENAYQILARSNALAGFTRLEQALTASFTSTTLSGAFEGGTYTATADVVGAEAAITTEGLYTRPNGDETKVQIRALIVPVTGALPADYSGVIDYSVLAGGNLTLGGTADIVSRGGGNDSTYAPLVHTNSDLIIGSGSSQVQGFGSYTGTATGPIASAFVPPYNSDGSPVVAQSAAIPLPPIDPASLASVFGVDYEYTASVSGTPAFSASNDTLQGGTREAPAVYLIHGDATLSNVIVNGYAVFIVDGNAILSGSTRAISPTGVPVESQIAMIATGAITLSGNSSIYGHLFAEAGLKYGGATDIYGSVMTHNSLSLSGTTKIHAYPSPPAFGELWVTGALALKVLAYTEF